VYEGVEEEEADARMEQLKSQRNLRVKERIEQLV
jgi:hypothetical protein